MVIWNESTLEQDDKINFNKTPAEFKTHESNGDTFVYSLYIFSAHILIQNDDWTL